MQSRQPQPVPRPPLAVVTGAGRGIGAAIAVALAERGFSLALLDRPGADRGEAETALRALPIAHPLKVDWYDFDLADVGHHPALVARIVQAQGPIHTLVNNAGVPAVQRADMLNLTPDAFDQVMGINLRGTFFLTQTVAQHMLQTDGFAAGSPARSIITVSSVSSELASVERAEYCLSKSALPMLTRLFALRLAELGVGVFEVRPGVIRTPMTTVVAPRYEARIQDGLVPQKRWGEPQDVARAVALLACGDVAFATGSVLQVDGGLAIPRL